MKISTGQAVFPDYLPGFRGFSVMDNKVCVRTYKFRDNKLEFYFYDWHLRHAVTPTFNTEGVPGDQITT
jgi:hypothetical protein